MKLKDIMHFIALVAAIYLIIIGLTLINVGVVNIIYDKFNGSKVACIISTFILNLILIGPTVTAIAAVCKIYENNTRKD